MKSNQVTIKDIARELGISPSTVSRALKDHPDTSKETKRVVNELAKKLNYEPNTIALSLRSQRTRTIGVIVPEMVHYFFSTIISGIEQVAYDAGYTVMFCQSNESFDKEVLDTKALLSHRVDGLLVSVSSKTIDFDHFHEVQEREIPIVFFDRKPRGLKASKVIIDDFEAACMATQHLIDQGCQKIAHLTGPANLQISRDRQEGYEKTLGKNGLQFDPNYVRDGGLGGESEGWEEGYNSMKELLAIDVLPDGVFANNDVSAYGAMQAIKEAGLKIPDDIAVIGFSNWRFSALVEPKLSTILQPGLEIGKAAAKILIDHLDNKEDSGEPITKILPTELIVRESSMKKQ